MSERGERALRCFLEQVSNDLWKCAECGGLCASSQVVPFCPARCAVSVRDVYGRPLNELKPPEGWRFGEFRFARRDELYFGRDGQQYIHVPTDAPIATPVLILLPVLPRRIVFTQDPTGEWGEQHNGCLRKLSELPNFSGVRYRRSGEQ